MSHDIDTSFYLRMYLQDLTIRAWRDLDENGGHQWPAFFTEAGVFDFSGRLTTGREALGLHFRNRAAQGDRVSVHLLSNLSAILVDTQTASVRAWICVFGGDGVAPIPISLPSLLGQVEDFFERQQDGSWLIALRRFRPSFYNPEDRVGRRIAHG